MRRPVDLHLRAPAFPAPRSFYDPINPFISTHVPTMWQAALREFGLYVTYVPESNAALATRVLVVWKDGAMLEEVTPGRYSHIYIQNADIPVAPMPGDSVQKDSRSYDVVIVDAAPYYCSRLIVQEAGPVV
jgi:hypothetical protein